MSETPEEKLNEEEISSVGDDDEYDVPLFCADRTGLAVLIVAVVAVSVLFWKVIAPWIGIVK